MNTDRINGVLFGAAYGDAIAAPVEFIQDTDRIAARFPAETPLRLPEPARVTDDTQMLLAVGDAISAAPSLTPRDFAAALRSTFVAWMISPDNNRAPGNTCMSACRKLQKGINWTDATVISSKGCGANMRVQPVGLLELTNEQRSGLAQLQAAMTHGHPTALAAADLTQFAIAALAQNILPDDLPDRLRRYAESRRGIYPADHLGDLWQKTGDSSPEAYSMRGWNECENVLDRLDAALKRGDRETDPCAATGAGWVAEEALATALLCFLLFPDDPLAALRRAAITSGDSDSIACLTGAFVGARHGIGAFPSDWQQRIEYRERLETLAETLAAQNRHAEIYRTPNLQKKLFAVHRLNDSFYAGRHPLTAWDVRQLAALGITHVLDLREPREWTGPGKFGTDALQEMKRVGIVRENVPVMDASAPTLDMLDHAADFIQRTLAAAPNAKIYVHCRAGVERTATVIGAVHARHQNTDLTTALRDLQNNGAKLCPLSAQRAVAEQWLQSTQSGSTK